MIKKCTEQYFTCIMISKKSCSTYAIIKKYVKYQQLETLCVYRIRDLHGMGYTRYTTADIRSARQPGTAAVRACLRNGVLFPERLE